MRLFCLSALVAGLIAGTANAAPCDTNFKVSGVALLSAMSYRTFEVFPNAKAPAMLQKLAQAVSAEGFDGVKIDKGLSSINAFQETTGSGRIQTLRVVARQQGANVRVDAIFDIQAGQMTDKRIVREGLCNILSGAR
jgi:hypothetical protein